MDGVLDGTGTPINSSGTGDLFIGSAGGAEYFAGLVDEVRIYDRNLSDPEITILSTALPPQAPVADAGVDRRLMNSR